MYYYEPWVMRSQHKRNNRTNTHRRMQVQGEGLVATTPNIATITLGIITENSTVTLAQNENNQLTKKVIDSLLGLGIANEHIKTVDFRIDILYDFEDSKQTLRGYRVTHMLQISEVNIQSVGSVVDTAVRNGANTVMNIDFTVRNPHIYYERALQNAVQDAQDKARTIAQKLGVALQEVPFQMKELSQQSPPIPLQNAMFAKSEATTPIQPGELTITARVEATFFYSV